MNKMSSVSSKPGKLVRVKAADVFNKPLTAEQEAAFKRLEAMPDSDIDYSDIPPLTKKQLSRFRPARDFEIFRRWEDQHCSPEIIARSEESRRRWHERHDPKS